MHIAPFQILDLEFVCTDDDEDLHRVAKQYFNRQVQAAVFKWRAERDATWCVNPTRDSILFFAVFREGVFWGVWHFYKIEFDPDHEDHISRASMGPAFPDLTDDEPDWERIATVIKWFLDNPIPVLEGPIYIDRIVLPRSAEGEFPGYEFSQEKEQVTSFVDVLDVDTEIVENVLDTLTGLNIQRDSS